MKIYKTCSPSSFVGKEEIHNMLKIRMSCGGGIGGSSWYEYIHDTDELEGETPVWVTNYHGERVKLNPKFMVKITPISLVKVTEDITEWKFYGGIKPTHEKYLRIRYIETPPYERTDLVNDYKYHVNSHVIIEKNTIIRRV